MKKPNLGCWAALTALLLVACQSNAPRLDAAPSELAAAAEYVQPPPDPGAIYVVQPQHSAVTIYVYRAGRAARLGHNHVLTVAQLEGWVAVPDERLNASRFSLRFPLNQLRVDDAALRAATGGGFSAPRSADDIAGTQHNMLKSLDADHYPWVVLNSLAVIGEWPVAVADVAVTLHGVTRAQRVVLHLQHDARQLDAQGSLVVRQSDFGIAPFSILGGALGVDDTLAIDFKLQLQAAGPTP